MVSVDGAVLRLEDVAEVLHCFVHHKQLPLVGRPLCWWVVGDCVVGRRGGAWGGGWVGQAGSLVGGQLLGEEGQGLPGVIHVLH